MARKRRKKDLDFPIVEVIWIDAEEYGETGWNSTREIMQYAKKPCPTMKSVGYCIHRDEHHIALISTLNEDNCSSVEKIPLSFVVKVNSLGVKPDADL